MKTDDVACVEDSGDTPGSARTLGIACPYCLLLEKTEATWYSALDFLLSVSSAHAAALCAVAPDPAECGAAGRQCQLLCIRRASASGSAWGLFGPQLRRRHLDRCRCGRCAKASSLFAGCHEYRRLAAVVQHKGFFATNWNVTSEWLGLNLPAAIPDIALPLGISFFTFHAISYLVDVYRRKVEPQRDPFAYALYILLFPQLIAGPIIRYHDIAHQLHERTTRLPDFRRGLPPDHHWPGKKAAYRQSDGSGRGRDLLDAGHRVVNRRCLACCSRLHAADLF